MNLEIYSEIKNGSISIEKIEVDQKQFKSKLNEITTGNQKQIKRTIRYKKILKISKPNSRFKFIKLYKDYVKIMSKAIYISKQGTRFKILTPKQMLQILPIALAQVK